VLLNVASQTGYENGRGKRFRDFTFEYLPIPEERKYVREESGIPKFRDLGFKRVKTPNEYAHFDPEFKTFTYGHVGRYGENRLLIDLEDQGILFFFASLQTGKNWAPYIIGYLLQPKIVDCRKLDEEQILEYRNNGFARNAHLKRNHRDVDLLIKGRSGSKRLKRAFPLTDGYWRSRYTPLSMPLRPLILEQSRNRITKGPWYHRTLRCDDAIKLVSTVRRWQNRTRWPDWEE
jgi:hypothetical protein